MTALMYLAVIEIIFEIHRHQIVRIAADTQEIGVTENPKSVKMVF